MVLERKFSLGLNAHFAGEDGHCSGAEARKIGKRFVVVRRDLCRCQRAIVEGGVAVGDERDRLPRASARRTVVSTQNSLWRPQTISFAMPRDRSSSCNSVL